MICSGNIVTCTEVKTTRISFWSLHSSKFQLHNTDNKSLKNKIKKYRNFDRNTKTLHANTYCHVLTFLYISTEGFTRSALDHSNMLTNITSSRLTGRRQSSPMAACYVSTIVACGSKRINVLHGWFQNHTPFSITNQPNRENVSKYY